MYIYIYIYNTYNIQIYIYTYMCGRPFISRRVCSSTPQGKQLDFGRGPLGFPQTRPSSSRARLGGLSCRGSGLFGSAKSGSARLGSSQPGSARPESAPPDPVWLAARAIGLALLGLAWHNLACSSWFGPAQLGVLILPPNDTSRCSILM